MLYFALIIPVIIAIVLSRVFPHKMAWWEYTLPAGVGLIIIIITNAITEAVLTTDTEYWTGWATQATYYEPWNETVPCTHAKYRTETYDCGTTERPATCTRSVFDGYEHAYDVDYHSERYVLEDSNNLEFDISEGDFNHVVNVFGNKSFRDMHRNYHTIDGDAYDSAYKGEPEKMLPVTSTHSYRNRVQASSNIVNYRSLSKEEKQGLYNYPPRNVSVLDRNSVMPSFPDSKKIDDLNVALGAKHEVRVWVLIYRNQSRDIASLQEAFWKGGNMNELVVCINLNNQSQIEWAEVFSWTPKEEIKVNVRTQVEAMKTLDMQKLAELLNEEIGKNWARKDFEEFNYLSVTPPGWVVVLTYILVTIASLACAAYAITNDMDGKS